MSTMKRIFAIIMASVMLAVMLTGCGTSSDTPELKNHNGKYVSEYGSLTFNGDGKSVIVDFSPELLKVTGLSNGEGTYRFSNYLFKENYYDAMHLSIKVGKNTYRFDNGFVLTSEDRIVVEWVFDNDDDVFIIFEREA